MKTNYELRYAAHPEDAKQYDTKRIRRDFLIEKVFTPNEVNMVYSMYDRMIVGGAMPGRRSVGAGSNRSVESSFLSDSSRNGYLQCGRTGCCKSWGGCFRT
mgnify:CR=1 FL=1